MAQQEFLLASRVSRWRFFFLLFGSGGALFFFFLKNPLALGGGGLFFFFLKNPLALGGGRHFFVGDVGILVGELENIVGVGRRSEEAPSGQENSGRAVRASW